MSHEADHATIEVFWRLHEGLSKQGPGSDESTRRALALIPELPSAPRILDLGCGPGRQSLLLARETGGHVTAVDLLPPFLEQVDVRAAAEQLSDHITTVQASMGDLSYADESFDLLWSEGAIYNIGFESGLRAWRRLLRPGCSLAVTECSWLTDAPAERIRSFWESHYPGMQGHEANQLAVAEAGYELLGSFVLPEVEWWDDYYTPIGERIAALRKERSDDAWTAALEAEEEEASIVRECDGSFGYVFYVMRKPQ
ncbi:MAG: class I SAM-dependent methyltransferase [Deltaproteobacteria bacterium]|nr:class I SAM-dependent methyltransferase [Deltaproteobacteria bacterium]MBW2420554.1 class I SAM-dependent methyltransferase [Deltaproteobacteria bacterium]